MQLSRKRFLLASLAAATSTALVACSGAWSEWFFSDSGDPVFWWGIVE